MQKERGFTDCAVSVHNFTLILCMSVLVLQFLCGVPTHTQLITHPKPQPAKIQFESQVWHVQLRCTNAAYSYLEKWDTLCFPFSLACQPCLFLLL